VTISSLHDEDFHAWAIQQAELLRAASRLESPDLSGLGLDFVHLIEEVEDLGRSVRREVEVNLERAMWQIIRIASQAEDETPNRSRGEVLKRLFDAGDAFLPSIAPHLDLDRLWLKARRRALRERDLEGVMGVPAIPEACPFQLGDLLDEEVDVDVLVASLVSALSGRGPDAEDGTPAAPSPG
jgi:hypothetical protein